MAQAAMFSANQMIDIAIQTEQAGRAFYEAAVQHSDEPQVKSLCQWLGEEELVHEQTFRHMGQNLPPEIEPREWPTERAEFIDALLGSRFMPKPEQAQALVEGMSAQDILDFALNFEKDTIIFFYEMRDMVPDSVVDKVNEIIAEEKAHVSRITKAKAALE